MINISSKKNAFVPAFTLTIRHFEAGLLKSPGKSGSARPLSGMKLGNLVTSVVKTQPQQSIDFTKFKIAALEKFLNVKRRFFNQFLVQ